MLTGLSAFWFARTAHICPNHLLALRPDGRSTECRRLEMLPLECVVRGYLAGSGWKDYLADGAVCGHALPPGLAASRSASRSRSSRPPRRRRRATTRTSTPSAGSSSSARSDSASSSGSRSSSIGFASRLRGGTRDHPRRHEARARARRRRPHRARGRGVHARLVPLLAGRRVRAGRAPAVVRQAVRARLLRDARLGQDASRPGAARRRRRRHASALRRGVRAAYRHPLRRLPRRPEVVLR